MQRPYFSQLLLLLLGLACLSVNAQEANTTPADKLVIPADDFGRGTPFRSAEGFLATAGKGDYETAAEYLDLRNLFGEAGGMTGAQLARRLNIVTQRANWIDISDLSDEPTGRSNDGLPEYRDLIGVVLDEGKETRLFMQKIPRGDGVSIWKISNATVTLIPSLYEKYGYPRLIEDLRHKLPEVSFLGYELFKWVIVFAFVILAYLTILLVATLVRRALGNQDSALRQRIHHFLTVPFGIWVVIMVINAAATTLGRGVAAEAWERVSPVPILVTVWFLFASMGLIRDLYATYLHNQDRPGALILLRPASSAIKVLIVVLAMVIYLDKLGVNITTLLAGLGVGGIAVALALQKPMEDMLGAVSLYSQQPVRVGDFCRIGGNTGTVEEIGLRTTRLRTLAHTLIAVPNHRLVNEPIDNISARGNIWYHPILRLRYDTTADQLRQVLDGIREVLKNHERVVQENHRVRFDKFNEHSLSIEVYAYLTTTDWAEFLELAEGLNLRIMEIVAEAGTKLFMPANTLHVE